MAPATGEDASRSLYYGTSLANVAGRSPRGRTKDGWIFEHFWGVFFEWFAAEIENNFDFRLNTNKAEGKLELSDSLWANTSVEV